MTNALRLGIAGLGTVGTGVLDIVKKHGNLLTQRAGCPVVVTGVSARSKGKDRGHDLSKLDWHDDPVALAKAANVDVFIELIGGDSGSLSISRSARIRSVTDSVSSAFVNPAAFWQASKIVSIFAPVLPIVELYADTYRVSTLALYAATDYDSGHGHNRRNS